jgi:predicted ATP-binding protein involved in virulence
MQLPLDDKHFGKERDILTQSSIIGLGQWPGGEGQIDQFKAQMEKGDIVLIKRGHQPIALVKVVGDFEYSEIVDQTLDWFPNRRKIEVLEIMEEIRNDFPQPRMTLQRSTNRFTPTYQYIDTWYHKVMHSDFYQNVLKINKIHIDSHKHFKNFTVHFTETDGSPLSIIVLAGINGSGKTTLLEYLAKYDTSPKFKGEDYIDIYLNGKNLSIYRDSNKKKTKGIKELKNKIMYLPATFEGREDLEKKIRRYIDELMFEKDYKASDAYKELQDNINEIFEGLSLNICFHGLNKDKQIFFKNVNEEKFELDQLSTGEKTLLSKVLYLYLSEAKNKIILIDEPELSLHPNWQNRIFKLYEVFAEKNNNQIILATHSPHIIASAGSESVKVLKIENGFVEVIEEFNQSYGLEFSKILTDIMGVEHLRPPEIAEKFDEVKKLIISNESNTQRFKQLWDELEHFLGDNDLDLQLLKLDKMVKDKNA